MEPQSIKAKVTEDEDEVASLPTKRLKSDVRMEDVVSREILDQKESLRQAYAANKPYPHAILPNVFDESFLQKVFAEIKANSQVSFKESDLFRVYQSIDFANLNPKDHQETLPTVLQLRQVLYSDEWRHFIEDVTGLERNTLTEQVDSACNCHTTGCHLLTHDDVIGKRKISYILYMTESDWQASEGGALELYDSHISTNTSDKEQRVPNAVPSKTALPLFNHLAFFEVVPGFSFHAVQEVLGERPRLSLQGWYHAKEAPVGIENATLGSLKNENDKNTEVDYIPIDLGSIEVEEGYPDNVKNVKHMSESDKAYLGQYLDETYLKPEAMDEIRDLFEKESSVQLQNFFKSTWIDKLSKAMNETLEPSALIADNGDITMQDPRFYRHGVSETWKLVGPAHKQRFLEYEGTSNANADADNLTSVGEILAHLRQKVLESAPFYRFLNSLTGLGLPTARRGRIRRFRPGLDYTVAHHGLLTEQSTLDATICFVLPPAHSQEGLKTAVAESKEEEEEEEEDIWESGEVGGFECYIAADDEDNEAAAEYNQDDDTELLSVSASMNTLSLVYRDPGTMRFVKYVGYRAPSSRWDIAMEYQVPEGDEGSHQDNGVGDDTRANAGKDIVTDSTK